MADEHRFSADVEGPGIPSDKKSRWQSCLIGCLVVFVVLFVVSILIAFWVSRNWRDWTANFATVGIRRVVSESQLPPQEQQEIMVQVDRVASAFRENKLTGDQAAKLMETFGNSPLFAMFGASVLEQRYFSNSGLSAEEKAAAHVTLQRFIRGWIDGDINQSGIDAAMKLVADPKPNGQWELRKKLSDDEIRNFLAEAKKQADEAKVPEQPGDVDISEEIKKIVDGALAAPPKESSGGNSASAELPNVGGDSAAD